ncbi:MAG: erythromycin esterase family protein [Planctomycetes bacterium]|nr:erythromycin esterase family protein [Planctomycetota bacterium]
MPLPRFLREWPWLALLLTACAAPMPKSDVADWLEHHGVPTDFDDGDFEAFDKLFDRVRVVGLGEATHGQHESFELKRELTLHLIEEHGFRWVAFEASSTRARATEEFVQGRSDDLAAAMKGLGMLIWDVEENAKLLRDLRAWNRGAKASERVHFVGIDVQDPPAAARRIAELLPAHPELGARAIELAEQLEPAVSKLWSGELEDYERVAAATQAWTDELAAVRASTPAPEVELELRATELRLGFEMFRSQGGRDRAMAEMLLAALARAGPDARAVVWAHNGHVMRSPLRYLESDELAMGGHLGAALDDDYYAFGFLFGSGGFQANDRDAAGAWGFRRYELGPPPPGSLEAPFVEADRGDFLVDLRIAPSNGPIGEWFGAGHGQRWFGGYNVAPDYAEQAKEASRLPPTFPRADFDGLVFLARTTAALPRDPTRILTP